MGDSRVGQEIERQVGKEESEKRLRDWLGERRVRQKIEKPDRGEESRQETERQVGKEESEN
jgi:hypothetical protein